jgi:hypothetical protein
VLKDGGQVSARGAIKCRARGGQFVRFEYANDDAVRAGALRAAAFYAKFHAVLLSMSELQNPLIIFAIRAKIKARPRENIS